MQLLFALVVIEFCSYIFLQNSENEVQYKKLYLFRSTDDISNCTSKSFNNNQEQNFMFTKFYSNLQRRGSNQRKMELQSYAKNLSILRSQQRIGYFEGSSINGRKLLNYLAKTDYRDPIKTGLFHESNGEYYTDTRGISSRKRGQETKQTYNEDWDEWGNWSGCSVTCGNGRQVRWRHCSAEDCMKGLKRAQIKPCRLKQCDKNILHWLGIKT